MINSSVICEESVLKHCLVENLTFCLFYNTLLLNNKKFKKGSKKIPILFNSVILPLKPPNLHSSYAPDIVNIN